MMRVLTTILVLAAWPAVALAADTPCTTDKDCPAGDTCQMSTCPACPPDAGTDCPPCDTGGICGPSGVVATPACQTDADCPTQFTCDTVGVPCAMACAPCACTCSAGDPNCDCTCPPCEEPPCTPATTTVCQYHAKECTADADCPAGFACQAAEVCSGTGCACPACAPDQECPPCDCGTPEPPTCEVTGHYCQVVPTTCTSDADCVAGFTCTEVPAICACPACACPPDSTDCGCMPCDCGSATKECLPKGWPSADYGATGGGTAPDTPKGDGTTSGTDATGGTGSPTGLPAAGGAGNESVATGGGGGSAGCAAPGTTSTPAWFLFLLPLIAFLPRAVRRRV